jgi:hypothetical protein
MQEDADYTAAAEVYSFSLIAYKFGWGACIPGDDDADCPVPESIAE